MKCRECGTEIAREQTEAEAAYARLEAAEAELAASKAENARMREVLHRVTIGVGGTLLAIRAQGNS